MCIIYDQICHPCMLSISSEMCILRWMWSAVKNTFACKEWETSFSDSYLRGHPAEDSTRIIIMSLCLCVSVALMGTLLEIIPLRRRTKATNESPQFTVFYLFFLSLTSGGVTWQLVFCVCFFLACSRQYHWHTIRWRTAAGGAAVAVHPSNYPKRNVSISSVALLWLCVLS